MPRHRTSETKSPPRIMIEVTNDQWDNFKRHLPYGFQKQVFKAIIQDMCTMWDEFGDDFTRAILAKNLTYKQFMEDYQVRTYGYSKGFKDVPFFTTDPGGTTRVYQEDKSKEERKDALKDTE
jgi:hypothetical protein